ncbi:MAG: hypothetical protein F6K10_05125 [Moorea sp. SIO2B7]|nr:hypothetical protein [Moorena sp. SIO2B7]
MSKTLTIKVPDKLEQQLLQKASQLNISLETLILKSLNQVVNLPKKDDDPLLPLLGTLKAEVTDIGENHDYYIGKGIQEKMSNEQ